MKDFTKLILKVFDKKINIKEIIKDFIIITIVGLIVVTLVSVFLTGHWVRVPFIG